MSLLNHCTLLFQPLNVSTFEIPVSRSHTVPVVVLSSVTHLQQIQFTNAFSEQKSPLIFCLYFGSSPLTLSPFHNEDALKCDASTFTPALRMMLMLIQMYLELSIKLFSSSSSVPREKKMMK